MDPAPPLLTNVDRLPCGCAFEFWSDGRELKDPCPPCGLRDAGQALQMAGQALCAVANSLARAAARQQAPLKRV